MPTIYTGATPNSALVAYAVNTDLTATRDWRQIADLLNDDNTRPASQTAVEAHATVTRAVRVACAWIESAVLTGSRYKPEDLLHLTELQVIPTVQGGDGTATAYPIGKELLVGLVCDLAFWWLVKRRKPSVKPTDVSGAQEALDLLNGLRLGERIFPFSETEAAGLAKDVQFDSTAARGPATPISQTASRFFGTRS